MIEEFDATLDADELFAARLLPCDDPWCVVCSPWAQWIDGNLVKFAPLPPTDE